MSTENRDMQATQLRCEHREDTPCIDTPAPRFSWTLQAPGRDRRQTGYRIVVGPAGSDLARGEDLYWDTGLVESSDTVDIVYEGRPLPPAAAFDWTVQVRDETAEVSTWAKPSRFRTGPAEWQAQWITRDRREDPGIAEPSHQQEPDTMLAALDPACYLRREFTVRSLITCATLYATARGLVELHLNGQRVGDAVLAPGWTDYHRRIEYQTYDVTDLVLPAANALGATLGEGWYAGHVGFSAKRRGAWYGDIPELLCELHLTYADGSVTIVASDDSWRATANGPIRYSDLLHGERYDARLEMAGWSEPGHDDHSWDPVISSPTTGDIVLVPERAQPARVTQDLAPVSIVEREPGVQIVDLGQNAAGWVRLAVRGEAGTRVELRFAEMLNPAGSLYLDNLRSARPVDTYILRGDAEVEIFEPHFTVHGFRYVEVRGLPGPVSADMVTGRVVHSDAPLTGTFSCSDELINQLYRNITWGQRSNFLSVPTDCPQRDERLGWLADAQVFLPTATLNMDLAAFLTKWGDDILDAQSDDGAYPDVAPRLVCVRDGAPAWADAGIIVPWTHYRRYRDHRLLQRHWPHMERYMAHLQRENPDLLWRRRRNQDYGDWLAIDEHTPKEVVATAYWAHDAALMSRMAEALGLRDRAATYKRLHTAIARAFTQAYMSDGAVIDGDTQTGYVLALAFDLLPPEHRQRAVEHLVDNLRRRDWHLATGFLGVGLLCPVLSEFGHGDIAHRLVAQDSYPSWGYSIRHGATTIWERWDGWTEEAGFQTPDMNSFNHYSLGSVGAWLYEYVAGIRLAQDVAGYPHVVIAPEPGPLRSARASYRSLRGAIASDWHRDDDQFQLAVTVPPNMTATVIIPAVTDRLTESEQAAADVHGVHEVKRHGDTWRVEIGSGNYRFVSK
jgi:alpha-L-rhamnosidase